MTWVRVTLRWLLCTVPNFIRSCVLNHMNIQSWFFVRFSLHNFIVSFSLFPLTFMTKKLFPSLAFEPRVTPMHLKNDPLDRSAIRPRHKDPFFVFGSMQVNDSEWLKKKIWLIRVGWNFKNKPIVQSRSCWTTF